MPIIGLMISFVGMILQGVFLKLFFFLEHGAQRKAAYAAALCTEEIAADYLSHRSEAGLYPQAFLCIYP